MIVKILFVSGLICGALGLATGGVAIYRAYTEPEVTKFNEPAHTRLMLGCINATGLTITSCECHEKIIVEELKGKLDGFTNFTDVMINRINKECPIIWLPMEKSTEQEQINVPTSRV